MKKTDNKLYEADTDGFERRLRSLTTTALVADITAALMLIAAVVLLAANLLTVKGANAPVMNAPTKETAIEKLEEIDVFVEPEFETEEPISLPATDEEIELLALVTMAEAEGESEEGKRLVIDTILNRVDSPRWPNTISEVIWQPSQFVAMTNGRAERCIVTDEVRQLVIEELLSRTNSEVVYFTAGGYGRYGTPLFQVGNHYFCEL